MKKAKLVLTVMAVFAVVGGALAFKANRFNKVIYRAPAVNQLATIPVSSYTLTIPADAPFTITGLYSTTTTVPVTTTTAAYFEL